MYIYMIFNIHYGLYFQIELVEPAVKGTLNVVKACVEAKVKRLVLVSSIIAVGRNPNWPKGQVMDETCWSDMEHCKSIKVYILGSRIVHYIKILIPCMLH